jgi:hypothetical protein
MCEMRIIQMMVTCGFLHCVVMVCCNVLDDHHFKNWYRNLGNMSEDLCFIYKTNICTHHIRNSTVSVEIVLFCWW